MVETDHEATSTEPQELSWNIVDRFVNWDVTWTRRNGFREDHQLYQSIDENIPYRTGPGLLRARLVRKSRSVHPDRRCESTRTCRPITCNGLRLAVASVRRHCPGVPNPPSSSNAPAELERWLSARCEAGVNTNAAFAELKWNVKPKILLWGLDQGHRQVLWLDADVVAAADFRARLPRDEAVFVGAEEFAWGQLPGSGARTRAWGLRPAGSWKRP